MGKHDSEPLKDLPRGWWIMQAAKALIAATGPNHRYMMMRDGFVAFQNRVIPAMNSTTDAHFDANDARAMWDILVKWSWRKERHLYPFLEKAYMDTRRHTWKQADEGYENFHDPSKAGYVRPDITTERVNRGTLDRRDHLARFMKQQVH